MPTVSWAKRVNLSRISSAIVAEGLDLGESEVLSFASDNVGYRAVIDDAAARRVAKALNIPFMGTLGILTLAQKKHLISTISEPIQALQEAGLWLSEDFSRSKLENNFAIESFLNQKSLQEDKLMIDINQEDFDLEPETAFLDLDNDGTYETVAQGFDTDADGQIDTWAMQTDLNGDGIADQTSVIQGIDTNDDGQIDTWVMQTDYDSDLIPDEVAFATETDFDTQPTQTELWSGDNSQVLNDPASDLEHWHQQAYDDTCAIASQEFILDELSGQDFSEDQLPQEACANGWYTPGVGTPLDCTGNLLEVHGIGIEKQYGCTLEDISNQLAQGNKVIVGLDANEIWNPGGFDEDDAIANFVGMPGQDANHAVQVVDIDTSDPDNPLFILNDPGSPNGQGLTIPAADFLNAWEDSNFFMVNTTGNPAQGDSPMLGDYADSAYHQDWANWNQQMADWH